MFLVLITKVANCFNTPSMLQMLCSVSTCYEDVVNITQYPRYAQQHRLHLPLENYRGRCNSKWQASKPTQPFGCVIITKFFDPHQALVVSMPDLNPFWRTVDLLIRLQTTLLAWARGADPRINKDLL